MAVFTTTAGVEGVLPEQYGALVVTAVTNAAVSAATTTIVPVDATEMRIPVVTDDPQAAWVAEGAEIPIDDPAIEEIQVVPAKVAGLTVLSSEMTDDSNPAAAEIIGQGLGRDIARKIDAAFYGTVADPVAPDGLSVLQGVTSVNAGAEWHDTDPFAEAISKAEQQGAVLSAFVANPADALILSTLRDEEGSNRPLLGPDVSVPTRRTILGVPLYTSPAVSAGTVWGYDRAYTLLIMRRAAELVADRSAFFTSDSVAIRAICRVGFAFPHPASIVKVRVGG